MGFVVGLDVVSERKKVLVFCQKSIVNNEVIYYKWKLQEGDVEDIVVNFMCLRYF